MLPYWLMLLVPAVVAFAQPYRAPAARRTGRAPWVVAWVALTLLLSFRYQVGGDWFTYKESYLDALYLSIAEAIQERGDPAYVIVNWVSVQLGWDIYGVNMICGAIFSAGLLVFCRAQPRPWLALTVAVPYLVIVVGMGYTRQSAAIGLLLVALTHLSRKETARFVFWVALGALFHKSAVIVLPIAILARIHNPWWTAFWVGATALLLYLLLVADFTAQLVAGYIDAAYESEGAAIRVAMNTVPAVTYLLFRNRMTENPEERAVWAWLSLLALSFIPLLQIVPSSTAVDRVALYMIPLQLYVLSRVPEVLSRDTPAFGVSVVIAYCAVVQYVWLNYAAHAEYWVPYRFYPFEHWL
jgi:hypothetical protein